MLHVRPKLGRQEPLHTRTLLGGVDDLGLVLERGAPQAGDDGVEVALVKNLGEFGRRQRLDVAGYDAETEGLPVRDELGFGGGGGGVPAGTSEEGESGVGLRGGGAEEGGGDVGADGAGAAYEEDVGWFEVGGHFGCG